MGGFTRTLCIVALATGCTKRLPPAPIPTAVAVPLPPDKLGPPPPGMGRVIIDVAEGAAPVSRIRFEPRQQDNGPSRRPTFRFFELPPERACETTPCVIDEPPGNILLGFPVRGCSDGFEYELVHVSLQPSVYRRALSEYRDETGTGKIMGIILASVGGAATITGIPLLAAGASDNKDLAIAGGITLGAGALVLTAGILLLRHDAATYRPGSANHYEPLPTPPPAPMTPSRSAFDDIPALDCGWSTRRGAG